VSEEVSRSAPPEIEAVRVVHSALQPLDVDAQMRVIRWVAELLNLPIHEAATKARPQFDGGERTEQVFPPPAAPPAAEEQQPNEDEEGISPVALKWMRRSGLSAKSLQSLFSLGIEEIDLIAKSVPGDGPKAKMRSVMLLKGIAAYLSTGVARMTHDDVKEACVHYSAYDNTNFSKYVKAFAAEVGGSKETGYTLTARGISDATELIKSMTS